MNSEFPQNQKRGAIDKILDLAFGSEAQIANMSNDGLDAHLKSLGINADKGWDDLQNALKITEGKARLAQARAKRVESARESSIGSIIEKTREALIDEIRGLLATLGGAVYARKWEDSSLDDLKALRDELVSTAARAEKKRRDEQQR
jgi:hypothetical protein